MRSEFFYQTVLILAGILVTALFGVFLYREIFPEYKIYQEAYVALEEFRSTYTHQAPPDFKYGVKQIVIERDDRGPPVIDRCTSCHVALQIPYFSPTTVAKDINGQIIRNENGQPILVPNEDYIWGKLDGKIAEWRDESINAQLKREGKEDEVQERLKLAQQYESLKTVDVDDHVYDMTKVLAAHPLIGKETRPFEFHPIEEYGCTSCHNGNGRGLVTDRAHGPVFDDQYETEFRGPLPQFTEPDPANDPRFSRVFNAKPSDRLLFQTQPLFVGSLIQAKCMQCHQTTQDQIEHALTNASDVLKKHQNQFQQLVAAFESDKQTLVDTLELKHVLEQEGYESAVHQLKAKQQDDSLTSEELSKWISRLNFVEKAAGESSQNSSQAQQLALDHINRQLKVLLGSQSLANALQEVYGRIGPSAIGAFLKEHQKDPDAKGTLFIKGEAIDYEQDIMRHLRDNEESFHTAVQDQSVISNLSADIDVLTQGYQKGRELYISQACYACHRIAGFARGGVGPELTRSGDSYPWFVKESIVWPQADLKTSTMPNMRLDHEELENLMTFLLAQKGQTQAMSQTDYRADLQTWEGGRKLSFEKPISPAQMYDIRYGMTVFATEGCASCHRLQGFDSDVGYRIEKQNPSFDQFYAQEQWFRKLFPETVRIGLYDDVLPGSEIVSAIERYAKEIDERIVHGVRQNTVLEEIEKNHPGAIEGLYSNFKFAARSKNHHYEQLAKQEKDPEKIKQIEMEHQAWQDRVHRVLMMYIQEYGLGRLIGPHLNWSGIFRSDQWLMEHFWSPTVHVPYSIMPVMPFDNTKFYALTNMLNRLGIVNRNRVRQIWEHRGFNPKEAFDIHCAQCHGILLDGHGPISEWIYPIPKRLNNSDFLRQLTKERAMNSIMHGVKGTPMPPWGEVAQDKLPEIQKAVHDQPVLSQSEIAYLVDWLFSSLPGAEVIRESEDVLKWQYTPEDVLQELKLEGGELQQLPDSAIQLEKEHQKLPEKPRAEENRSSIEPQLSFLLSAGEGLYASISPEIYPVAKPKETREEKTVGEVFDIIPNPEGPDPERYYIKKKYYTPYNLQEGQKFFLLNCASCHGTEADGKGPKAVAMQESKPRMLTNLDWIQSRDDLRLLRSIKYGVPGTAMTPWGDQTNSIQRLQLVMFIRTLSQQQDRKRQIDDVLYKAFDRPQLVVDRMRIEESGLLDRYREQEQQLRVDQLNMEEMVKEGRMAPAEVVKLYAVGLSFSQKIEMAKHRDQSLINLKNLIKKERDLYQILGTDLINKNVSDELIARYLQLLDLHAAQYQVEQSQLTITMPKSWLHELEQIEASMVHEVNQKLEELKQQQDIIKGRMQSPHQKELLATNQGDQLSYQKLKGRIASSIEDALHLIQQQQKILDSNRAAKREESLNPLKRD